MVEPFEPGHHGRPLAVLDDARRTQETHLRVRDAQGDLDCDRLRSNASERLAQAAARSKSAARVASSGRSRADTIRDTR